jgi:hypothetical protein
MTESRSGENACLNLSSIVVCIDIAVSSTHMGSGGHKSATCRIIP